MNPNYPYYYPNEPYRNTPNGPIQGSVFPGLGEAFPYNNNSPQTLFAPPAKFPTSSPAPSIGPLATLPAVAEKSTKSGSLFSLDKLSDLKGIVDRIGGLDGIIGTMTKAQKVIGGVQQMAPLIKLMMGSFGKKDADDSKLVDLEDDEWTPPKKRKSTKKKRRTSSGGGGGFAKGGGGSSKSGSKRRPSSKKRPGSKSGSKSKKRRK
ncbi:hypothetical protein [Paenibacillus herberti]|uniref:Tyrosine protein kinase n=1 Tax=Paenibacillus herberti TaxID=1619309 RepID=A0A229NVS0_9BACL|nr:hypothetical protein [Paenibacillus herberti]OXM13952.1 hypothetical protein CGZ75_13155 [Paenibacillus herberti]